MVVITIASLAVALMATAVAYRLAGQVSDLRESLEEAAQLNQILTQNQSQSDWHGRRNIVPFDHHELKIYTG